MFQGDEKVLVTGPWYSQSADYQILFDGCGVATTLVQSGVLRCYTPGNQIQKDYVSHLHILTTTLQNRCNIGREESIY